MANHVEIMLAQAEAEGVSLQPPPTAAQHRQLHQLYQAGWSATAAAVGAGDGKKGPSKTASKSSLDGGGGGAAAAAAAAGLGLEGEDAEAWVKVVAATEWDVRQEVDKVRRLTALLMCRGMTASSMIGLIVISIA